MVIHAISLVKNEADIIEDNLTSAARWCDHIYVMDNGSSDGTWERVQELARTIPNIVPFKQDPQPFHDGLRDEVFQHLKERGRAGDWWAVLDADEFYVDNPVEFLREVPFYYRSIWPQLYTYLFTEDDAEEYARDPQAYESRPARERMRHYMLGDYSEGRFFRQFNGMAEFPPLEPHPIYHLRIRMRHYPYRSPRQIARRLETRLEPMGRGEFTHEKRSNWPQGGPAPPGPAAPSDLPRDWEERIVGIERCHLDEGDATLLTPLPWAIVTWDSVASFPPPRYRLAGRAKRLVRSLLPAH